MVLSSRLTVLLVVLPLPCIWFGRAEVDQKDSETAEGKTPVQADVLETEGGQFCDTTCLSCGLNVSKKAVISTDNWKAHVMDGLGTFEVHCSGGFDMTSARRSFLQVATRTATVAASAQDSKLSFFSRFLSVAVGLAARLYTAAPPSVRQRVGLAQATSPISTGRRFFPGEQPVPLRILQLGEPAASAAVRWHAVGLLVGVLLLLLCLSGVASHLCRGEAYADAKPRPEPVRWPREQASDAEAPTGGVVRRRGASWADPSASGAGTTRAAPKLDSSKSLPSAKGSGLELCRELVVPPGCECVVAIKPLMPQDPVPVIGISDLGGKPLLKAHVRRPLRWQPLDEGTAAAEPAAPQLLRCAGRAPAVALHMLHPMEESGQRDAVHPDGSVLATCLEGWTADGQRHVLMYDAHRQFVGNISKDGTSSHYVFAGRGEDQMVLEGIFADHVVQVCKQQWQLAETEPCRMAFNLQDGFYRLRCIEGVDVGLLVCCLIAIDEMEMSGPA